MQMIYTCAALAAAAYCLFPRRRFDMYGLAILSTLVYFLPGFFGFDSFGTPLDTRVYYVFLLVLGGLVLLTLIRAGFPPRPEYQEKVEGDELLPLVATAAAAAIGGFILLQYGLGRLLLPHRLSGIPDLLYVAWRVVTSFALVCTYLAGRKRLTLVNVALLALIFLSRDRTAVVMVVLAILLEWFRSKGSVRLLAASRRIALPVLLFVALTGTAKLLFAVIYSVGIEGQGTVRTVQMVTGTHLGARLMRNIEPFITQSVLNQVFHEEFYIGPAHLQGVIYQVWPAPSQLGHPSGEFNALFQKKLFPQLPASTIAYNFWAEAIAAGGWLLLGIFIGVYAAGLSLFDRVSRSPRMAWRALGLTMGPYWAFYIHRNSLANIVAYERHVLYVAMPLVLAAAALPLARAARARMAVPAGAATPAAAPPA